MQEQLLLEKQAQHEFEKGTFYQYFADSEMVLYICKNCGYDTHDLKFISKPYCQPHD